MPEHDTLFLVGVFIGTTKIKDIENGSNIDHYACLPGFPNVFVAIYPQIDWIHNVTKGGLCESGRLKKALLFALTLAGLFIGSALIVLVLLWIASGKKSWPANFSEPTIKKRKALFIPKFFRDHFLLKNF